MGTSVLESERSRPTREQALATARRRLAARKRRTSRLRKIAAVFAAAAFIGPFGVIYAQMAEGRDPAVQTSVPRTAADLVGRASASAASTAERVAAAERAAAQRSAARDAAALAREQEAAAEANAAAQMQAQAGAVTTGPTAATTAPAPVTTQQS